MNLVLSKRLQGLIRAEFSSPRDTMDLVGI